MGKMENEKKSTKLHKIKSALFNVIYLMLKQNGQTVIKEMLIISIESIQLLSFSFHPKVSTQLFLI